MPFSSLDEYLGKESELLQKKANDISLDQYLNKSSKERIWTVKEFAESKPNELVCLGKNLTWSEQGEIFDELEILLPVNEEDRMPFMFKNPRHKGKGRYDFQYDFYAIYRGYPDKEMKIDEYLGKQPKVQEESDPEGRILFNTSCTLTDFGMEGAVGPKHYVALSGGKDSSAMLIRMLEIGMPVDHVLFADTGMEFPEIYAQLRKMDSWLQTNHNLNITWLKPRSTWDTWFYGAITRGKMKGQRRGYPLFLFPCWWTREAKFKVMDPIIGCGNFRYLGFAADEPKRLKPKPGYRYPLAEWGWTEGDALRYLTEKGLDEPIHHKFNRTGCYLCPKQHVRSLTTLHDQYPELWAIAKKYEADSIHGFRPDLKLSDIEEGITKFKGPQEVGRFG